MSPGVVEGVAGGRVDATHGADHLRSEQDVLHRDHAGQQVDPGLVVHAGVEEDVVQQMLVEQRLLQLLRQAAKRPEWYGTAPPPCGIRNFRLGKSLNRSPLRHCMNAVVSAFR
jgi:hypothetical protein